MKFKSKILCLLLVFVLLFSLSAVAANETTTQSSFKEVSADPVSVSVESNNEILGMSNSEESLGAPDDGTFKSLQEKINNTAEGDTLVLENNYKYTDFFVSNGISISKSLTIDGNGYTIDALQKGRIFQVTASNVILKNINFVNGFNTNGGAVDWSGANGNMNDCTFVDCSAYFGGGAVLWTGTNGSVYNCDFMNCSATGAPYSARDGGEGGAICWRGNDGVVSGCCFVDCSANYTTYDFAHYGGNGGAIRWRGNNSVLDNSSFVNCSSGTFGGAVYWAGAPRTTVLNGSLTNCSFVNCSAGNGGAVDWSTSGSVTDSSFVNCSAGRGGAIECSSLCVLNNCIFEDCSSNAYGGAVCLIGANGNVSDCIFVNCSVTEDVNINLVCGGAVYWYGANGVLDNCSFVNCSSDSDGGAVYWEGRKGSLTDSTFENCSASIVHPHGNGGAVYWDGDDGSVTNCSFVNNFYYLDDADVYGIYGGGAVYWEGRNGSLSDSTFVNNSASQGGAVYWFGDKGSVYDCSFENCSSIGLGNAIFWHYESDNGSVYDCSFVNCSSNGQGMDFGGTVRWEGDDGSVTNCSFVNCSSGTFGGAVYWSGANGTLSDSNFTGNNANQGGAVYWTGNRGSLIGSSFINNIALQYGGAVYWGGSNGTLSGSSFINNFVQGYSGSGGAVHWGGAYGTLSGSSFTGNDARYGGAVYWGESNGTLSGSSFINNSASYSGGAVDWGGSNGTLSGSNFTGNNATRFGGAVYWGGSNGTLSGSSFTGNNASNGGAVDWSGINGVLSGSNFTGNNASNGGAVFWDGAYGVLSGSNFTDNNATGSGGAVYWYGRKGNLTDSNFTHNHAYKEGGAVIWDGAYGTLSGSNFTGNNANQGGAVYWTGNRGSLIGSSFINNIALQYGGSVFWFGNRGSLSGSNFTGNNANNTNGYGGAVYWDGAYGILSGSNFIGNNANSRSAYKSRGGAVYWAGADGTLINSNFTGNNACSAGAVYWAGVNGSLSGSSFINNFARSLPYNVDCAGAVYWAGVNGSLSGSSFINNFAHSSLYRSAGAVFWVGVNGSLSGSSFISNSASSDTSGNGGAVYWDGANGTLTDSNFTNNSAFSAGAVFWNGVNGTLTDSNFTNNSAGSSSGAVFWQGANGSLSGSSFINNSARSNAGGAIGWVGVNGTLSGSNFTGNNASLGGAVWWHADNGTLSGSSFINNSARSNPGGAVFWSGANGTLSGSSFINNSARSYPGGAVSWSGANGTLSGSNFISNSASSGNSASEMGGAVSWSGANGTLTDSNFTNNFASRYGGAVYWDGANGTLTDSSFINNSARSNGGAVRWNAVNGSLSSSYFAGNNASSGGAVYWDGANGTLTDSNFTNDSASQFGGGAVYWGGANGTLSGSNFINNIVTNHFGGAVYWGGANGTLSSSIFINNSAHHGNGGAVFWGGANGNLSSSNFTNNSAQSAVGGAIYWLGANGSLSGSNFINNSAIDNGGAIYWMGVNGSLSGSNFINNSAKYSGGAIYWMGVNGSLSGSNFINNFAHSTLYRSAGGGAVYWGGANGTLSGSNFINNNIVTNNFGGAVYWNSDNGTLSGSNFTNNSAPYGGAIYFSGNNLSIDVAYFNYNRATKGSAIFKGSNTSMVITNTVFGRNRADADRIVISTVFQGGIIEPAQVTVKVSFYANDNIANAIWNNDNLRTVKLANITCEFSYDGTGREYKTFNKYDVPKAIERNHYVKGSDELWQSPLENAQLIDINITDSNGNVIYSIVNGTETRNSNVERNLLKALLPSDVNPVNVTNAQGEISIKLSNLKAGSYKITAKHQSDDYYTMKSYSNSFVVRNAPLIINKTVDNPTPVVGQIVKYNLTVVNPGSVTVRENVTLVDTLSDGLEYAGDYILVGGNLTGFTVNGNVLTWVVTNITNSSPLVVTVDVRVVKEGTWGNNFTLGNGQYTVSANITTVLPPSFSVEKISLTPTVVLGQSAEFEIVIRNTGKTQLTNVYFTEDSFDGLIYDSAIGEGIWTHKFENAKHTWTFNDVLKPGEIIELILRFNTTASGKFTNFVSAGSDQTEVLTANATVDVLKPEFKVEKIVLTPKVALGEQVIYEIIVHNTGEADLTNIVVEEMPDASLIFDHYVDGGLFKHSVVSGKHIWTLDKLNKGTYAGFKLYFNTTATGNISNKISVKSDEVPENITTSNNTTVLLPAFTLEKISLTRTVVLGQTSIFQIVIKNTGKVELTDVYFTEDSFNGLIYDSAIGEGIWTHKFENNKHTWTFNDVLEPGEIITLTLRFNTTASGEFTNFVSAGSNQTEVLTANATVTVLKPEFKVEKILLTPKVALGEQVIYEIVIRNTGEADLTNIVVEEMPDASLIFDHYVDGGLFKHSVILGKHIWTLDKLAKGNYAGFRLYFNTTATGNISNMISVKSDEVPEEIITSNNTTVLLPAFSVEKICLVPNVLVGNQTQFQIVIKNTGKIQLTDVYFTEESFNGLIYDSAIGEGIWTHKFENGKHTWTLNKALEPGEIIGLTLIFNTTAKGNFTNFVSAGSNQTEVLTANATVHVFEGKVPEPPVQNLTGMDVFKTVITQEAVLGGQITFQIVVHNTGNTNLENVKISEILPDGLIYDHFTDYLGLWRYNNDLTWSATRAILPGEYAGFFVTFNTTKAGRFENHIVVNGDNTNITPANTSFDVLNPSFTIEKILVEDYILNGTQATFEIVIHNTGNASLSGVTVKEYGFNGLIYSHFADYLGVWTYNGDLSWTMNSKLLPGEYAVLAVTFYTTTPGNFTNFVSGSSNETGFLIANATVHVLDKTGPEQNSSDDYKMDVFKTVITQETVLGGQITFQIVVHNTGNRNLENVKITEILPDGLIYSHFVDYLGLWTYNGDLTWSATRAIVPGEYVGFFVTFNTTKAGRFENHIVVTSDKGNATAGNTSFEVLNPDFTIEKILVEDNIANGGQATFEIVIHNTGTAPLTNLTVREYFFEGLVYDHFVDYLDLWTYNGDLSWTMNSKLLPGEYVGFFVTFNTTKDGKFSNIVVANSTECGDKFSNNATVSVHNETVDIRMVCLNPLVIVGNQVTFEITVQNTGNIPITALKISEYDFEGLIYNHYMDYLGHWINDGITWTLNTTLVPGEVTSLFVVFNTTRVGNFTNVILVNNDVLDTNELLSANSLEDGIFVSAGVEVVKPEYTIEIVALNKTVENGEEVTFEVIVHNIGKVDVSNITVRDIPSDGLNYVDFIDNENFWSKNNDLSWDLVKVLVPGQYSSFYIVFNTTKSGILENTIVSDNLTSKATVEVKDPVVPTNPGLTINVEVTTDPITGQPVLKVTVTNIGNVDLDNVFVKANLPEGLKYGNYYSYDSIWNLNNGVFDLEGLLKVGESKSFFIEILGNPGDYQIKIDAGFNGTIADSKVVSVKVLDNSTPGNITPEVPKDNNVKQLKSSVATGDNATGNPLVMLLLVLIALGITRLRKKD